jgi:UDP-N-acetyl-2-amino-2-deoxyglucuronate dehydrogenase
VIKFALIGCGKIGTRHAEHIAKKGKLLAVCDINKSKATAFGEKYKCKSYVSLKYLLEDLKNEIDVVAICTPNGLHAEHSILALEYGCHVLCEKPLAISSNDGNEMIAAGKYNNRYLFVVKQHRFNPPVVAVKKCIDNGYLGKILSIQLSCFWNRGADYYANSWKGTKDLDGGTLFTQFSHFIDLLYWMFGDVSYVSAITKNLAHQGIIDFEDTGVVIMEFKTGAIGTINYTVNAHGKNMEGSLTVFGEKGTVKIGGQYLNELEYQNIEGYEIKDLPKGNVANNYGNYFGSMSNHDKVYENVINVLENGNSITTNAFESLKTVEIIERIYAAAKKNK